VPLGTRRPVPLGTGRRPRWSNVTRMARTRPGGVALCVMSRRRCWYMWVRIRTPP